jgi:hypothetical protein
MPRIAIELDMPPDIAEAAEKMGLLSSNALLGLIKTELIKNSTPSKIVDFNPADYPPGFEPWMVGKISPILYRKGIVLVSDEEFIKPI